MPSELADDNAISDAMAQEVMNHIRSSQVAFTTASPHDEMREPWGGHFRAKQKPVLALSAMGEA